MGLDVLKDSIQAGIIPRALRPVGEQAIFNDEASVKRAFQREATSAGISCRWCALPGRPGLVADAS